MHAFSRFGGRLNEVCYMSLRRTFAHMSHLFRLQGCAQHALRRLLRCAQQTPYHQIMPWYTASMVDTAVIVAVDGGYSLLLYSCRGHSCHTSLIAVRIQVMLTRLDHMLLIAFDIQLLQTRPCRCCCSFASRDLYATIIGMAVPAMRLLR